MPKVACPFPEYNETDREGNPVFYLELPSKWTVAHAQRRDDVVEKANGAGPTVVNFMVALALLDSWHLPGVSMQQVKDGEVGELDLELVTWVTVTVLRQYQRVTICPKGTSLPLSVQERIAAETERKEKSTDGDLESET